MLTIEEIAKVVCETSNTTICQVTSKSRKRECINPRFAAMKLAKEYTKESLTKIGNFFNRDHTTVIHAIQTIDDFIDIRESQPLESALYFSAKEKLNRYLLSINGNAQNVFLNPHPVPTC